MSHLQEEAGLSGFSPSLLVLRRGTIFEALKVKRQWLPVIFSELHMYLCIDYYVDILLTRNI